MLKRYNKILIIMVLPLLLTSCWDYRDVNRRSINLAVGVDDVDGELEFTGEIAKLTPTSSQSKSMVQITDVYKYRSKGEYFEGSRNDYDSKLTFPGFLGAIRVIMFSKNYAEKSIESYINRSYFTVGLRSSSLTAVCKESTNELFSSRIQNDISIGYAIEDTVRQLDQVGLTVYKTVQEIQSDIALGNIGYVLPYVTRENNSTIKYLGFAVMKDSKLISIIDYKHSKGFLYLMAKKTTLERAVPHPQNEKNLVSLRPVLIKRTINTKFEDNKINIYINLNLETQLQYEYNIEPLNRNDMKKLEDELSKITKEDVMYAINRSQNEMKCDVFGFARYFRAEHPVEYKKINWKEEYPKANIHVNVKTTIKNTSVLNPNGKKPD